MQTGIHKKTWRSVLLAGAAVLMVLMALIFPAAAGAGSENQDTPYAHTEAAPEEKPGIRQLAMNDYLSEYHYYAEGDYWAPFAVAALYEDGTVQVACHEEYRASFIVARRWRNIERIWMRGTTVFGLDQQGRLYNTNGYDTAALTGVEDIVFADGGIYAIGTDGTLTFVPREGGYSGPDPVMSQWTGVEKMLPYSRQYLNWGFFMLRQDGTLASSSAQAAANPDAPMLQLENVRDIFVFDQKEIAVLEDGTVYCAGEEDPRLRDAVKVVAGYEGLYFAMTDTGQLKIGGNMTFYEGAFSKPGWYTGTAAIRTYGVADILDHEGMRCNDIVLLYRDGTVFSPKASLNEVVRDWKDIRQIGWYEGFDYVVLYGLRSDGSVIAAKMSFDFAQAEVFDNYRGWRLDRLYVQRFAGALGIGKDGSVVGDYAFENVELSKLKK